MNKYKHSLSNSSKLKSVNKKLNFYTYIDWRSNKLFTSIKSNFKVLIEGLRYFSQIL